MRADGDGKRVKYYDIELENVIIANLEQVLSGGNILHDSVELRYSKIKHKYTQQKIGGGAGGNTAGGWDLATNRYA
jgi:type VI secretion system secreted protein Hcp